MQSLLSDLCLNESQTTLNFDMTTERKIPNKTRIVKRTITASDHQHEQPRYLKIANDLTLAISDGHYPIGAQLPTEAELCTQFGISRFTAREAVRNLVSAGLVTRRQRTGTIVIATPDDSRYTQDAASLSDLFQYAQDTTLNFVYIGKISLTKEQARDFGAKPGDEWIYATGIRRDTVNARPICVTRLFINPVFKGIEDKLRESKMAVYALIEKEYKISIKRVDQELQGVVLDVHDAGNLGVTPGVPGLRILRRYYDYQRRLVEVADNIHPSDRFTYHMQLSK